MVMYGNTNTMNQVPNGALSWDMHKRGSGVWILFRLKWSAAWPKNVPLSYYIHICKSTFCDDSYEPTACRYGSEGSYFADLDLVLVAIRVM